MNPPLNEGWLPWWQDEKLAGELLLTAARQLWYACREKTLFVMPRVKSSNREKPLNVTDWVYPEPGMHLLSDHAWFGLYGQRKISAGNYEGQPFINALLAILTSTDLYFGGSSYGISSCFFTKKYNGMWTRARSPDIFVGDDIPPEAIDISYWLVRCRRMLNGMVYVEGSGPEDIVPGIFTFSS